MKVIVDFYLAKRKLLRPYAAVMKRVMSRANPSMAEALAIHNYGPAIFGFILRTLRDRDVLFRASVDDVRVVFDVGAFDGQWSSRASAYYPEAAVFAFEPGPSHLRVAGRTLARFDRVKLFDYGLSDANEEVRMVQRGPGSTACTEAVQRLDPQAPLHHVVVSMRDVKHVLDELHVGQVDLFKVNIEGGEYRLLDRLIDTGYIERCRCLLIQFHEWYPDAYALRRRIHRALRRTHDLDWSDFFVWERWTRKGEASSGAAALTSSWLRRARQ